MSALCRIVTHNVHRLCANDRAAHGRLAKRIQVNTACSCSLCLFACALSSACISACCESVPCGVSGVLRCYVHVVLCVCGVTYLFTYPLAPKLTQLGGTSAARNLPLSSLCNNG